jgi:DNA polymerase III subunit epsilon
MTGIAKSGTTENQLHNNFDRPVAQAGSAVGLACFLDVETTGLSSSYDEIVELALCLFEFTRDTGEITNIVDQYVGLREPDRQISRGAGMVHGLSMDDVRGKCLDTGRVETMLEKAEFLIAHNASFDRGFMIRMFQACSGKQWLCSMNGINWKGKGFTSRGLQNLLRDHGIKVKRSHRARDDVRATIKLLSQRDSSGKSYFFELLEKLGSKTAGTEKRF